MKFTATAVLSALLGASSITARPALNKRGVDPNLVPPFGITANTNPDGHGNCDGTIGPDGKPILIPCACPPAEGPFLDQLNANVAAGHAVKNPAAPVNFPTDNSPASQIDRIQAVIVTLQNLNGPGQGCPAASTTLLAQQQAIQSGQAPPPPAAAPPPPPAPAPAPQSPSVASLAPPLGFTAGKNPTGTGDCDGAVNGADGQPIKIPCSCPPPQDVYISALESNVQAGFAVNNPSVKISFPFDNSAASQHARINAAVVTIQNLNGPGKGCPVVSTTLQAQDAAIH